MERIDFSVILFLSTVVGLAIFGGLKPELFRILSRSIRPLRTIHYLIMGFAGIYLGQLILGDALGMTFDLCKIIVLEVTIFFIFQSSVVLNDFYDLELDKISGKKTPLTTGAISPSHYKAIGIGYTVLSLLFGLSLSYPTMLMVLACHFLSIFYSVPPFRLKKVYPLSTLWIAISAVWAALVGFSVYAGGKTVLYSISKLTLVCYVVFTLAFNFKDLLDVQGDRRGGIVTLFTLLGEERGRIVNSILMLVGYCLVPVILSYNWLFIASVPTGLATAYFSMRKPFREPPIFYIYFVYMAILGLVVYQKPDLIMPFR